MGFHHLSLVLLYSMRLVSVFLNAFVYFRKKPAALQFTPNYLQILTAEIYMWYVGIWASTFGQSVLVHYWACEISSILPAFFLRLSHAPACLGSNSMSHTVIDFLPSWLGMSYFLIRTSFCLTVCDASFYQCLNNY